MDANDPQYTTPGGDYKYPPSELWQSIRQKCPATADPYVDEWGTYVSAFVPVLDPQTGELLAVLGVDIIAGDWQSKLNATVREPLLITLAIMLLFACGIIAIRWRNRRKRQDTLRFRKWIIAPTALAMLAALEVASAAVRPCADINWFSASVNCGNPAVVGSVGCILGWVWA